MQPIGPVNALYPMPTTLVGAMVNGKPNFLAVAHVGILNHGTPQYLSIGLSGKIQQNVSKQEWYCYPIHSLRTFLQQSFD